MLFFELNYDILVTIEVTFVKKYKLIGTVIGAMAFIALIAGITYAWFTWTSGNTILGGSTECFTINYVNGQNISGEIIPSATYLGGKKTTVQIGISPSCNIGGTATLKLTSDSSAGTAINLSNGVVKYAVYDGTSEISSGSVNSNTMDLATVNLTKSQVTYTIYVWIDGTIVDNSYSGKTYSGYIHASAEQTHE